MCKHGKINCFLIPKSTTKLVLPLVEAGFGIKIVSSILNPRNYTCFRNQSLVHLTRLMSLYENLPRGVCGMSFSFFFLSFLFFFFLILNPFPRSIESANLLILISFSNVIPLQTFFRNVVPTL